MMAMIPSVGGGSMTISHEMTALEAGIISGVRMRFKDPLMEEAFADAKFQASRVSLLTVSVAVGFVTIANHLNLHIFNFKSEDYSELPVGAVVVMVAQSAVIFVSLVCFLLLKFGTSWSANARDAFYLGSVAIGLTLASLLGNFSRAGALFHGDCTYLWSRFDGGEGGGASDSDFVAIFLTVPLFVVHVPMVRASRSGAFLGGCLALWLLSYMTPGLSPEPLSQRLRLTFIVVVYYPHYFIHQLHMEMMERLIWIRERQMEMEVSRLHVAEEQRERDREEARRRERTSELLDRLDEALECGEEDSVQAARRSLELELQWTLENVRDREVQTRRRQSQERGIRLSYLLSEEFAQLARTRTGKEDPTFHDMKEPFFLGPDPIGRDMTCPRDGGRGCSLVDSLPARHRGKATHFLSWTWGSKLSLVRDALDHWAQKEGEDLSNVCFFMCFFVNNQYRILVPGGSGSGCDDLEATFETNLKRINRMVALLDTFEQPVYLTRIWTIFEQFTALRLNVEVSITLPCSAGRALIEQFEKGKEGIALVRDSMSAVDSSSARATEPEDERRVRERIQKTVGFKGLDAAIKHIMSAWVGTELRNHMDTIMEEADYGARSPPNGAGEKAMVPNLRCTKTIFL